MKKIESYKWALKQIRSKIKNHVDIIATLANTAAILKERHPHFFWVGFYFSRDNHLLLGPFQGPPACVKLSFDYGVCAAAARQGRTVIVQDVSQFEGHVACDDRSKSEIVVPLFDSNHSLKAVLDVDSEELSAFDATDALYLEKIAEFLKTVW